MQALENQSSFIETNSVKVGVGFLKNVFQIEITNNHFTNTVVKLENFRAKLSSRNNYFKLEGEFHSEQFFFT